MAKRVRVEIHRDALRQLMQNTSLVEGPGAATAAACNAASTREDSYFQHETETDGIRARCRVWAADDDPEQLLVRNLGG